jgi:hypothetical protein
MGFPRPGCTRYGNDPILNRFCLPHASLHQPLLVPEPTNGRGSAKLWRPCTGDGGWINGPRQVAERGAALSRATVAAAADTLKDGVGLMIVVSRGSLCSDAGQEGWTRG